MEGKRLVFPLSFSSSYAETWEAWCTWFSGTIHLDNSGLRRTLQERVRNATWSQASHARKQKHVLEEGQASGEARRIGVLFWSLSFPYISTWSCSRWCSPPGSHPYCLVCEHGPSCGFGPVGFISREKELLLGQKCRRVLKAQHQTCKTHVSAPMSLQDRGVDRAGGWCVWT